MNILITGNLSSLACTFATELTRQKHRVVLASRDADSLSISQQNAIRYSIDPARDIFEEAMSSYGFDIVVFIATREEQLVGQTSPGTGHQLDALRNTLELSRQGPVKRFFFISSTEVYGNSADRTERAEPVAASLNGRVLATGEEYCKHYHRAFGLNVCIVRLPYVYGPDEKQGLLSRLIEGCRQPQPVTLPGSPERVCNFLHASDIADFLNRAIEDDYTPASLVVNLSSSQNLTNLQLSDTFRKYFQSASFVFDEEAVLCTAPAVVATARRVFDWVDVHDLHGELARHTDLVEAAPAMGWAPLREVLSRLRGSAGLLKPLELLLGAVLTQYLSQLTGTLIQYKYVDFRLLFVVVMASMYGLRYGLLSALLMSVSLVYTWYQLQIDWSLLIFNVGNWFPPVLYFVTGLILGYSHDRNETVIENERNQTRLIYEKYQFLYEVFNEIRRLKDEFREQVIGYRDSFGKIYTVTRELDTLQEQNVYLRALAILEDLMENNNIAIYRLEPDLEYARLEVSSTALHDKLAKSLKLSDYPEAFQSIGQGVIFQNTALLPNYPAYLAPIFNNSYPFNVPVAIVVIWSVSFERYSTYYYNLFKVICGLTQASLVRATKFLDANYEKMYIPATRILRTEAFNEVLRTRAEMNKNKIATDQLLIVDRGGTPLDELYLTISDGIRGGDVVGMRPDGNCYILLAQADRLAAKQVVARLEKLGLRSRLLQEAEVLNVELQLIPASTHAP